LRSRPIFNGMKKNPYIKKILPNGLPVVLVPMESTEAVTLLVLVGTGSKYETRKINGISHFLEHLFFKGTKHRPNPGDVHHELDRIGAEHNAFTSKEVTGYWVKTASKYFDTALDVISDILLDPLFKEEEIEKERAVILQEISMYNDNPMRKVSDDWEELLYGDQPAGWNTAGSIQTLKGISRDDIVSYRHSQYVASNSVVIVAGKIDPDEAFRKIKKSLTALKVGHAKKKLRVKEKQSRPAVQLAFKKTDQTHFILGARGYDMYDRRRHAMDLLGVIVGGNASSRFFMEIREKRGLAYYVKAIADHYTDTGYLAGMAGVRHDALKEAVKRMVMELKDIALNGPTEEEVSFAKDNLRGSLALSFESTDEIASFYGERELFYKNLITPQELFKNIEKVSRNDIIKVAREIFKPNNLNLVVIGPHRDSKLYQKLIIESLK